MHCLWEALVGYLCLQDNALQTIGVNALKPRDAQSVWKSKTCTPVSTVHIWMYDNDVQKYMCMHICIHVYHINVHVYMHPPISWWVVFEIRRVDVHKRFVSKFKVRRSETRNEAKQKRRQQGSVGQQSIVRSPRD